MSNIEPNPCDNNKELRTTLQPVPTTSTSATTLNNPRLKVHIDPSIKAYIDESIRSSTTSIIGSFKQYIDSQFDKQRLWNEQLQANINNILQPQRPVNSASILPTSKGKETAQPIGKYPSIPVLNDLIMRASRVTLQGQNTMTSPSTHLAATSTNSCLFKLTSQKYSSFDYRKFKGIHDIHGFSNIQQSWKDSYPWLEYDTSSNRMFCTLCHTCNKANAFATSGSTNLKLYVVKEHEQTKDHVDSYKKDKILNIPSKHIVSLMKIIYYIAKYDILLNKFQPLTYLGHAIEASHLISKDHLITYENNFSLRELLFSISVSVEQSIWNELDLATAIRIIVDESTDIASEFHIIIYGSLTGVATRMSQINPYIFTTYCIAHRLLLACEAAEKQVEFCNKIFQTKLVNFSDIYPTIQITITKLEQDYLNIDIDGNLKLGTNLNKFFMTTPPQRDTKIGFHKLTWAFEYESNLTNNIITFTSMIILELKKQFPNNSFINVMNIFNLSNRTLNSENILEFGNEQLNLLLNFYGKPQSSLFPLPIVNSYDTRIECVECECGFSKQNLIKTKLHSSLNNNTLHMLIMIRLEGPKEEEFDFDDALKI
ncbi:16913_t:CDS:2, partial [Cetraspora pellucida]